MGNASLGELLWVVQAGLEPKGEISICLEKLELARNPFLAALLWLCSVIPTGLAELLLTGVLC